MIILILTVMLCMYTVIPYTEKFLTIMKMTLYYIYIIFKKKAYWAVDTLMIHIYIGVLDVCKIFHA